MIITEENKKEIFYNIINSLLAGLLVFFGSMTSGQITIQGVLISLAAALVVCVAKFKEYWDGEKSEYQSKIFNFL